MVFPSSNVEFLAAQFASNSLRVLGPSTCWTHLLLHGVNLQITKVWSDLVDLKALKNLQSTLFCTFSLIECT